MGSAPLLGVSIQKRSDDGGERLAALDLGPVAAAVEALEPGAAERPSIELDRGTRHHGVPLSVDEKEGNALPEPLEAMRQRRIVEVRLPGEPRRLCAGVFEGHHLYGRRRAAIEIGELWRRGWIGHRRLEL